MEKRVNYLIDQFKKEFQDAPSDIFSSPGRIELCGNHTDHNNGKVLVSSIDLNILAAVRKREDNVISFISEGFDKIVVDLNELHINEKEYGKSVSLIKVKITISSYRLPPSKLTTAFKNKIPS